MHEHGKRTKYFQTDAHKMRTDNKISVSIDDEEGRDAQEAEDMVELLSGSAHFNTTLDPLPLPQLPQKQLIHKSKSPMIRGILAASFIA